MIDVLSPPGVTPPPAEPPPSPAMPPPEPTVPAEIIFQTRITHEFRGLPDFGNLSFRSDATTERLEINNEVPGFGALSLTCRRVDTEDQQSFGFAFRTPNTLRIDPRWPNAPVQKGVASQAIELTFEESEGGGATTISDDTPLPVTVTSVNQIRQADGSLAEDRFPVAATFDDLQNKEKLIRVLDGISRATNYIEALTNWQVAKSPTAGEQFDPGKHNMPPEASALLQRAKERLTSHHVLLSGEALKRNPNAFR